MFQPLAEPEVKNSPTCFRYCVGWTDGTIWSTERGGGLQRAAALEEPLMWKYSWFARWLKSSTNDGVGKQRLWFNRIVLDVESSETIKIKRNASRRSLLLSSASLDGVAPSRREYRQKRKTKRRTHRGCELAPYHIWFRAQKWIKKTTPPAPKLNTTDRVNMQAARDARKGTQASHWVNLLGSKGAAGGPGCRLAGGAAQGCLSVMIAKEGLVRAGPGSQGIDDHQQQQRQQGGNNLHRHYRVASLRLPWWNLQSGRGGVDFKKKLSRNCLCLAMVTSAWRGRTKFCHLCQLKKSTRKRSEGKKYFIFFKHFKKRRRV